MHESRLSGHWCLAVVCFPGLAVAPRAPVADAASRAPAAAPEAAAPEAHTNGSATWDSSDGRSVLLSADASASAAAQAAASSGGGGDAVAPSATVCASSSGLGSGGEQQAVPPPLGAPCMLFFDSYLTNSNKKLFSELRYFLECYWQHRFQQASIPGHPTSGNQTGPPPPTADYGVSQAPPARPRSSASSGQSVPAARKSSRRRSDQGAADAEAIDVSTRRSRTTSRAEQQDTDRAMAASLQSAQDAQRLDGAASAIPAPLASDVEKDNGDEVEEEEEEKAEGEHEIVTKMGTTANAPEAPAEVPAEAPAEAPEAPEEAEVEAPEAMEEAEVEASEMVEDETTQAMATADAAPLQSLEPATTTAAAVVNAEAPEEALGTTGEAAMPMVEPGDASGNAPGDVPDGNAEIASAASQRPRRRGGKAAVGAEGATAPIDSKSAAELGGYLPKPEWFSNARMPQLVLKRVPQQPNEYDCGLYMLHFIETLSMDATLPDFTAADNLIEHFNSKYFTKKDIDQKRDHLHRCITALARREGLDIHPDDDDDDDRRLMPA